MARTNIRSLIRRLPGAMSKELKRRHSALIILPRLLYLWLSRDTPVKTGRARGNWVISIGNQDIRQLQRLNPSGEPIQIELSKLENSKPGDTINISNNLTYIQSLEDGTSTQAPEGFVRLNLQTLENFARTQGLTLEVEGLQ